MQASTFLEETDLAAGAKAPEARPVLAVDLDGTLLRSDMLHETFWNALSTRRLPIRKVPGVLAHGRAGLKAALAEVAGIDPATLPYDAQIIDRIVAWRRDGGRVALVTASDLRIARAIADHLGLFDDVFGSTEGQNLKGSAKAERLVAEYGREGFVYIGDSRADLPVWAEAAGAVAVGGGINGAVDAAGRPAERLPRPGRARAFLHCLRPHQWLKNLLVFVPIVADPGHGGWQFGWVLATFAALSLVASAGYVVNDLLDLADDRSHPRKRARPFASGALSAATGTFLAPALLGSGLLIAALVSWPLAAIVAAYFLLTMSYSLSLKRFAIVDICTLAGLYTIRIIAGGIAIGVSLSVWLLAFSLFVFFSLAAAKRLGELSDADAAGRSVSRRGYTVEDRRILSQMAIAAGYIGVLVLALYIDEPFVQQRFGAHRMFWGVCALLIFWISRLVLVADRGEMDDDPIIWSLRDPLSRATVAAVALLVGIAVLW
jgi:4-hydroxybenzoate polyprenyltransferase